MLAETNRAPSAKTTATVINGIQKLLSLTALCSLVSLTESIQLMLGLVIPSTFSSIIVFSGEGCVLIRYPKHAHLCLVLLGPSEN